MKKIYLIAFAIVVILLVGSCWTKGYEFAKMPHTDITYREFTYKGHEMLWFQQNGFVMHSPDCHKCYSKN